MVNIDLREPLRVLWYAFANSLDSDVVLFSSLMGQRSELAFDQENVLVPTLFDALVGTLSCGGGPTSVFKNGMSFEIIFELR